MLKNINILNFFLYLFFFIILVRIYYLQVVEKDIYLEKYWNLTEKQVLGDTMPRGKIYDRNGNILVDNQLIPTIYFKNEENLNTDELIKLAYYIKDYIELDYSKLTISYLKDFYILTNNEVINSRITDFEYEQYKKRKLTDLEYYKIKKDKVTDEDLSIYTENDKKAIYLFYLMNNGYSYDDKIIKKNATDLEFAFFSESNDKLKGFDTKYTYDRLYLYGDTLKSILGKVGNITLENKSYYLEKGYTLNDTVGLTNLEYQYDDYLKGEKEVYKIINQDKILIKDGKPGKDLYLTIDINLQKKVEEILTNEIVLAKTSLNTKFFDRSYVSITDPNNGEVLAMVGKLYHNEGINDYSIGVITDTMTPGSVVKAASILVGYNEGKVKIGEYMVDECIKLKATPKKCSIYTMGYINDLEAIYKSSNVYQFKIALRIGGVNYQYDGVANLKEGSFDIYRNYFKNFGLGEKTGIDLPNESKGYQGKKEDAGLLMNLAIGQYDTYSNLELNQYIATIANGKNRYQMHLMKEIKNENEVILKQESVILNTIDNIKEEYIVRVKKALQLVMTEGTGRGYINLKLNPSGKTGTSETFADSNQDGIYETKTISTSFVAYFPTNEPKYAIAISSPNISYINDYSTYIYPFNKIVISKLTDYIGSDI